MTEQRKIPNTEEIKLFFHCSKCLKEMPADASPREWISIEAGWTSMGFQVWCIRHDINIIHMDFEGQKHPANSTTKSAN